MLNVSQILSRKRAAGIVSLQKHLRELEGRPQESYPQVIQIITACVFDTSAQSNNLISVGHVCSVRIGPINHGLNWSYCLVANETPQAPLSKSPQYLS